jgi:hypothetical protein
MILTNGSRATRTNRASHPRVGKMYEEKMKTKTSLLLSCISLLLSVSLPILLMTDRTFGQWMPPIYYPVFPIPAVVFSWLALRLARAHSWRNATRVVAVIALIISVLEVAGIAYLLLVLSNRSLRVVLQ